MTTKDNGYAGARREYHLKADDLIIDAHGLADDQEVIVNTNVLLKSTNEAYQPEWEKPCWIVAIKNTLGVSEEKIKELALKHDWDGKSDGLAVKNVIMIVWDLIGHMPDLSLTKDSRGMTPKEFSGTQGKTGLVFTKAHVMPMVNGKVSNFNGHGEEEIAAVATYKGKK
jgi:hypothetical protein